ncbi:MAG: MMPL family transporter [Gammaproteobacteria bacterium]|nr:MMPL family transporter [Gammaproteobacteria bacterium]
MRKFEKEFGFWVIKHRWWIIAITLILVALAASGGRYLSFTTNYRVFFSEDNPQLLAFEALENTYTKNDNIMFALAPKDGKVFTPQTLAAVEWLTRQAWQIPYSTRVGSITNFQHTQATNDELIVRDLITGAEKLSRAEIARAKSIALAEPLLANRLISRTAHVTAVNVTIQIPGLNPATETPEVVAFARKLAKKLQARYPHIKVYLTGMVMMNNAFSEASKKDIASLVPISFILMLIILGLLLRGFSGAAATLFVIAFSILIAMGLGGYFRIPLTPPSATAPTVILTVAIANSVHILVNFLYNLRHGMARNDALAESLRVNLQPVFLASLTTALGFLSMNFAEVPPFRHLGNLVAIGVASSFLLSVTFLPALLSLLPLRERQQKQDEKAGMARLGEFVVRRRRPLLWSMSIVVVLLVSQVPRNELNDVFLHYFDDSITFRTDTDFIVDNLTGMYQIEYSLESGQSGGISEPAFLKDVEAFAQWYRNQPETVHVSTLTDTMKRLNKNMHNDDASYYRLPDERNLAAQYLLLYEMSLPYGLDLNNQINVDKSSTRMVISLVTLSTAQLLRLEKRAKNWLATNITHIKQAEGSGTTLMFAHIGKRNIITMLFGSSIALFMISLLLIFALRSIKMGLASMIPNLVPAAMGFGVWAIFVGEIGLALSVVTGMTLGIVVDDTVHFLSKYLRARREKNYSPQQAVVYAFTVVGRALVVTSIVLVAGFLVLALSSFELNAGMGLLTAIIIAFALSADFLLLPPLLIKFEEKQHAQAVAMDTATDPTST